MSAARRQHLEGALGLCFIAAGVGLFVPAAWTDVVFAVVLVCAMIGLYDVRPEGDAGDRSDP